MYLYPSIQEGLAWLEGSDQDWADYAGRLFADAVKRREDEPADIPAP